MLSIWERQSFLTYDYIVIGAGIVGLSTAISLKEKSKKLKVLILERGILPTGASTKNAGFACFGSFTEILSDIEAMGESAALQLVEDRWVGLMKLRQRLKGRDIQYFNYGGHELLAKDDLHCMDKLHDVNQLLKSVFDKNVFSERKELVRHFGFNTSEVRTVIYNPFEGQLDTGKMMKSLILLAYSLGIEIITGAEVTSIDPLANKVSIEVDNRTLKNSLVFEAAGVAICTNAFSKKLLPDEDLSPGRGLVMVTEPIPGLKIKGTFHFQQGYYYFRDYENRILFGGGRNLDIEKEATTEFLVNKEILSVLHGYLQSVIIPGRKYEIGHIWTGIMAFGKTKEPIIKKINPRIVAGIRLGGMGVAIGSLVGEKLAVMLMESTPH